MRLLFIVLLLTTSLSYADMPALESVPVKNNSTTAYISSLTLDTITPKTEQNNNEKKLKLDLVLPKELIAKVKEDEVVQQREQLENVLPSLFNKHLEDEVNISGAIITSADLKERGDIDGAKIQISVKQ